MASTTTMADESSQSETPWERRMKRDSRIRIVLACNHCHARKRKCDGKKPVCSRCRASKKLLAGTCAYERGALDTEMYVSWLEGRLKGYEAGARPASGTDLALEARLPAGLPTETVTTTSPGLRQAEPEMPYHQDIDSNPSIAGQPSLVRTNVGLGGGSQAPLSGPVLDTPPHRDPIGTDATVVVSSSGCSSSSDPAIAGSSNTRFVRSMMKNFISDDLGRSGLIPNAHHQPRYGATKQWDIYDEAFLLPPRAISDGFVSSYWEFLHPIFPILHSPTFMRSYDSLWTARTSGSSVEDPDSASLPELVFLSTVNIVLAIGCQFSDHALSPRRVCLADKLYQRSKALFVEALLDTPSLPVVQCLLLTGIYLQSTTFVNRCWNVIGQAVRAAQTLGLHLDRKLDSRDQFQREMDRRVWHTCVFLDRQLATTFGRPMMISTPSQVPMPEMIDDEYLTKDFEGTQPLHIRPLIATFIYSNKLFDILNDILTAVYFKRHDNLSQSTAGAFQRNQLSTIMRFNRSLSEFEALIPDWLTAFNYSGPWRSPRIELGAKILYSRLFYTRILLLRPVLLLVAQPVNHTESRNAFRQATLETGLATEACRLCVGTAQTLVAHIYENMDQVYWASISHRLHYAFSCAVVLIAARLGPVSELIDRVSLNASWSHCIEIFEHYKLNFTAASYVLRILGDLETRLQAQSSFTPASNEGSRPFVDLNGSMGMLDGLGFDSNWAVLNDLLPGDSLSTASVGNGDPSQGVLDVQW